MPFTTDPPQNANCQQLIANRSLHSSTSGLEQVRRPLAAQGRNQVRAASIAHVAARAGGGAGDVRREYTFLSARNSGLSRGSFSYTSSRRRRAARFSAAAM